MFKIVKVKMASSVGGHHAYEVRQTWKYREYSHLTVGYYFTISLSGWEFGIAQLIASLQSEWESLI